MWCEIHMQEIKKESDLAWYIDHQIQNANMSYLENLSDSLENALNESMPVFLIGDFNIDM